MRSETARLAALSSHDIDIELAFTSRGERNELTVWRPMRAVCLYSIHGRELDGVGSVWIRNPNLLFSRAARDKGAPSTVPRNLTRLLRFCGRNRLHRQRRGWR